MEESRVMQMLALYLEGCTCGLLYLFCGCSFELCHPLTGPVQDIAPPKAGA